ncbi:FolC bifunctional protein [Podospora conica]|nr:FolC bifunctional protein [Schizothecium conicum]
MFLRQIHPRHLKTPTTRLLRTGLYLTTPSILTTTTLHHHPFTTTTTPPTSKMAPSSRTYTTALHDLSTLQSNRATVSLFTTPTPTPTTSTHPLNLNAPAIPEMLAALQTAGYTPSSLAASNLRCVHVAGTKGKGSVSTLVASILAQYPTLRPVGLYTSPHLVSVRERIVLDGAPISKEKFTEYFYEVWDRFDGVEGGRPHYFRFLTILAFHVFVREGVRDAVVECGIGGEYDATNVLGAEGCSVAVVTQLGVDHEAMLGRTRAEVAWHKAGVWKAGRRGVTRRLEDEGVMGVLRGRAREKGAELVEVGGERFAGWRGVGEGMEGPWVRWNMVLAVAAAREHLVGRGVRFEGGFAGEGWTMGELPGEFERGLREARLRGRCETVEGLGDGVVWFVDGAHTDDSLAGVGEWFVGKTEGGEGEVRVLVFNQQDRDPGMLVRALLRGAREKGGAVPVFTHAVFTRNEETAPAEGEERDLSVQNQGRAALQDFDAGTETHVLSAVQPAVELVRGIAADARKDGKVCKVLVTGSFHLVGAVLRTIEDVEE